VTLSSPTVQNQLVSALKILGVDSRAAIEQHEVDPLIYLLQEAGADLGYRFEWERYGPFSDALAEDVSEVDGADIDETPEFDEQLQVAAQRVREAIGSGYSGLSEFTWMRLVASVHFLRRHSGLSLTNGDRPPLLLAPPYETSMVEAAKARADVLIELST
jgi:hypothetical protein